MDSVDSNASYDECQLGLGQSVSCYVLDALVLPVGGARADAAILATSTGGHMTTTTTFESDLTSAGQALDDARAELRTLVASLADADLATARRGGWTIARVLHHIIQGETYYTGTIGYLN